MADDQAFLSARVPLDVRNRFKTLAASKGRNVQELLREVVNDYLREQQVPEAASVIRTVREHRRALEDMGLERLSLVGSVARGEAKAGSDIDFAFAFKEGVKGGLFDYGKLQYTLEDWLPGFKVDIAPWKSLRPSVLELMARDSQDWLEDILRAIIDIEDFVQGFDKAIFLTIPETDRRTFLALTSAIMQIGEAIKSLSPELKARHPSVDWRSATRTRDLLAHHYDRINIDIIWDIVSGGDLAILKAAIEAELT